MVRKAPIECYPRAQEPKSPEQYRERGARCDKG